MNHGLTRQINHIQGALALYDNSAAHPTERAELHSPTPQGVGVFSLVRSFARFLDVDAPHGRESEIVPVILHVGGYESVAALESRAACFLTSASHRARVPHCCPQFE